MPEEEKLHIRKNSLEELDDLFSHEFKNKDNPKSPRGKRDEKSRTIATQQGINKLYIQSKKKTKGLNTSLGKVKRNYLKVSKTKDSGKLS